MCRRLDGNCTVAWMSDTNSAGHDEPASIRSIANSSRGPSRQSSVRDAAVQEARRIASETPVQEGGDPGLRPAPLRTTMPLLTD
jgi:hypothetical protein